MAQELKRFDIVGKYRDEETMYEFRPDGECYDADEVDAVLAEKDAEIRRLERALYKACVNWMTNRQCAMGFYGLEARAKKFDKAIATCRAKAEAYR